MKTLFTVILLLTTLGCNTLSYDYYSEATNNNYRVEVIETSYNEDNEVIQETYYLYHLDLTCIVDYEPKTGYVIKEQFSNGETNIYTYSDDYYTITFYLYDEIVNVVKIYY